MPENFRAQLNTEPGTAQCRALQIVVPENLVIYIEELGLIYIARFSGTTKCWALQIVVPKNLVIYIEDLGLNY